MADGSIRIDVGMNTSKAERQLEKLKGSIASAQNERNKKTSGADAMEAQLHNMHEAMKAQEAYVNDLKASIQEMEDIWRGATPNPYSFDEFVSLPEDIEAAKKELSEAEKLLQEQEKSMENLDQEHMKVLDKLEKERQTLEQMETQAGELEQAIAASGEQATPQLGASLDDAKGRLLKFAKAAVGIASLTALFRVLRSAIAGTIIEFAQYDKETAQDITNLKNALTALKASWGAAFAPILSAVTPLLQTLIGWLTAAANAVARFLAILGGRTTFKKAVAKTAALESGLAGVGAAAAEAKKQLMGFDELNILSRNNCGGNAGYDLVEEAVDAFDGSFLSNLALSVKDVLFTWDDLNAEVIAEKIIAGLGMVLGAALGIMLGVGPGGILMLTLGGLAFGLVADALIFNHDGVLSKSEVLNMLTLALSGLVGGIIGFYVGGPLGAAIGITVGTGVWMLIKSLIPKEEGEDRTFKDNLLTAINTFIGGAIGFVLGGPAGAFLGMTVSFGVTLLLQKLLPQGDGKTNTFIANLCRILTAFVGGALFFKVATAVPALAAGMPAAAAALGAVLVFGILLSLTKLIFGNDTGTDSKKGWVDKIREALHFPSDQEIKQTLKEDIWENGVVPFFKEIYTLFSGEEWGEQTKEEWIEKFREALNFPEGTDIKEWAKDFFWTNGLKAMFGELLSLITGGEWTNPKETWIEKIREALNFPEGTDFFAWLQQELWENGIKAEFLDLYSKITGSEWTGAFDAGEAIAARIIEGLSSIGEKLQTWWDENIAPWFTWEKWRSLGENAFNALVEGIKSISFPTLHFEMGSISWDYNVWPFGSGTLSIPWPNITWGARGGILDGASLIGAGEAGKEALIPLEKNTEWVRIIADGIMERMASRSFAEQLADAFISTPMPAMAGGAIIPPNSAYAGFNGEWGNSLMEEIKALRGEISALASQPIEVYSTMKMNQREVGEALTVYQRQETRARG